MVTNVSQFISSRQLPLVFPKRNHWNHNRLQIIFCPNVSYVPWLVQRLLWKPTIQEGEIWHLPWPQLVQKKDKTVNVWVKSERFKSFKTKDLENTHHTHHNRIKSVGKKMINYRTRASNNRSLIITALE